MACDYHDVGDPMDLDPPTTFYPFPKLPKEIRDMIWSYAVINIPPRTVEISKKHDYSTSEDDDDDDEFDEVLYAKQIAAPAIFHVCWESRSIAIKNTPVEFGAILDGGLGAIYFDYSKDTLLFDQDLTLERFLGRYVDPRDDNRTTMTDEQRVEVERFCANIKFVAFRWNLDFSFTFVMKDLWRAQEISFLNEEFRYWPWPGRPEIDFDDMPTRVPSIHSQLGSISRKEQRFMQLVEDESKKAGIKEIKYPCIEYKDISLMQPSSGNGY